MVAIICWGAGVCLNSSLNAEESIKIVPKPLNLVVKEGKVIFTNKSALMLGKEALTQERYAAQSIKKELKEFHKLNLPILSEGDNLQTCDTLILIGQPETNKKIKELLELTGTNFPFSSGEEGFLIKVTKDGKRNIVLIAGSDANGVIYGCYTLLKLLKTNEKNTYIPIVEVSDKPSLKWRIDQSWMAAEDVVKNANYNFEEWKIFYLDWLARWGVNVLPVWTHAECLYPGESSPSPITKELVREAHLRGIKVMPIWSYLYYFEKQGKCLANDKDVADVLKELKGYIDAGVDKLSILFDDVADYSKKYGFCHCAKCQQKFGDPATEHLYLMEKIVKLVQKTNPEIDIYFCPTNYSDKGFEEMGYQLPDPITYNKKIASAPFMKDVSKFYTFFRAKYTDRADELGLTNYVFWYNGVRPRMSYLFTKLRISGDPLFSSFWGFVNYYWGWSTYKSPVIGSIELQPDTISEFSTLHKRTDSIFLATGGTGTPHEYISALNGVFTWHPETFSQEEAEGEIVNSIFGRGSYENYLGKVNRIYHTAMDYYLTSPDHTPETLIKGKKVLEEMPRALKLLSQSKGTYKIEGGHLPEKITSYYFREFEKALNLIAEEVKTLCKEEEEKWSKLSDQVSFGYRHWKKSSGDTFDKEADAKDIDDSMGEHKARAINETVTELQCKGVEWTFSTPKPGDYSLVMSLLIGGNRLARLSYKGGDRWIQSPVLGKGLPERNQTITLPISIPKGQTETRFRFKAIFFAYIYNASLFFSKERTDIPTYQKIDSLKFGTKHKSEMEKHQVVYKVHTESKEQLGGSSGVVEWQFITPKGGKFFINLTVISGPERKSQLIYNAGEDWIELPEMAPEQDALREIVFSIEVPSNQEKTSFRWRVTSGFSYLSGAELLQGIPGK